MMPQGSSEFPQRPAGGGDHERATVSTECPNCGAPIDFDEGIHAVECHHCRTHLLITGRKRLQTYSVAPRVTPAAASAIAQKVLGRAAALDRKLFFIPYYRFTAHDFFWFKPGSINTDAILREGVSPTGWKALFAEQPPGVAEQKPVIARSGAATGFVRLTEGLDLKSRRVDRTFIASTIELPSIFSLGIRGSALKLRVLQWEEVKSRGSVIPVSVPADAAVRLAQQTFETVAMRATVSQSLSLIYFPYWLVRSERRAILIDGVTAGVADPNVPPSIANQFAPGGEPAQPTIALRALTCPNCGWDFPVRPEDVAFLCSSCDRGWQLIGADLQTIDAAVADVPVGEAQAVYLPFWVLTKPAQGGSRRFFVPAFQYKNLRQLHQTASNLTGNQPQYTTGKARRWEMIGCYYDEEDAHRFSRFLEVQKAIAPGAQQPDDSGGRAVLTWIPFGLRGNYLVDPFLGFTNLTLTMLGSAVIGPSAR